MLLTEPSSNLSASSMACNWVTLGGLEPLGVDIRLGFVRKATRDVPFFCLVVSFTGNASSLFVILSGKTTSVSSSDIHVSLSPHGTVSW